MYEDPGLFEDAFMTLLRIFNKREMLLDALKVRYAHYKLYSLYTKCYWMH
jgi:hypothetical protein